jgi:uncharacterized protein YlzI (FlbEa/FlbD family)
MKLLQFKMKLGGQAIYINPEHVVTINSHPSGGTVLTTLVDTGDEHRVLAEDIDTVFNMLTFEENGLV